MTGRMPLAAEIHYLGADAALANRMEPLLCMALSIECCLRRGELAALKVQHVMQGVVHVVSPTGRLRHVGLKPEIRAGIESLIILRNLRPSDFLFQGSPRDMRQLRGLRAAGRVLEHFRRQGAEGAIEVAAMFSRGVMR